MSRRFTHFFITAILFGSPVPVLAQIRVQPGSRVRIEAPTIWQGRQVGTVSAVSGDTMFVAIEGIGGDDRALTLDSIERLEVSTGRHGNAGIGAAVGFASGALFGLLLTLQAEDGAACGFSTCTAGEQRAAAVIISGGLLGGLGALIGAASKTDNWTDVDHRFRIGLFQPRRGRLGIGASVSF